MTSTAYASASTRALFKPFLRRILETVFSHVTFCVCYRHAPVRRSVKVCASKNDIVALITDLVFADLVFTTATRAISICGSEYRICGVIDVPRRYFISKGR